MPALILLRGTVAAETTPMLDAIPDPARAQESLTGDDAAFRLLVNSVKDHAIFMLNLDGEVITWNAGAERIKGYRAEEILGVHFSRFYPPEAVSLDVPRRELEVA